MKKYKELQKEMVRRLEYGSATSAQGVSVVPMRSDFTGQPERSLTTVTFIGQDIGSAIQETVVKPLARLEPEHHYYPTDALHLTIKNVCSLADPPAFSEADIKTADRVLRSTVSLYPALDFALEETVALRNSVAVIGYSGQWFKRLIQELDDRLRRAGLPDDKRYVSDTVFFSNITVCRFVHPPSADFLKMLAAQRFRLNARLQVSRVNLIVVDAVCSPETRRDIAAYTTRGAD